MADGFTEFTNNQRDRDQRVALSNQVQMGQSRAQVQLQPNGLTSNASGYWKGDTWVNYFIFGVSKFGGPDVLR